MRTETSNREDMPVITFVSLFLSLMTGVHPVTFAVSEPVVALEVQLDGQIVGVLRGAPWTLACDFGARLTPHELVAIGRDAQGREVARKTQWINLPQPQTSLDLFVEDGSKARVVWQSIEGKKPTSLRVTFDGEPLQITDPQAIPLPSYDRSEFHILSAELRFGNLAYRTELTLGGVYSEAIKTELTAIPVMLAERKAPSRDEVEGWFLKEGRPLKVVDLEQGPADIVMVQDPSARVQDKLRWIGRNMTFLQGSTSLSSLPSGLRNGDRFHLLLPIAESSENSTVPVELFPLGPDLAKVPGGILAPIVGRLVPGDPSIWDLAEDYPRVRDAVAVAGLAASAKGRPRAVILVTSHHAKDLSRFDAAEVRRYLSELRVPLVVWAPFKWKEDAPRPWGPVLETTSPSRMTQAVNELQKFLARQAVVWVEGLHLPQQIELSSAAAGRLELAGASADPLPDLGPEQIFEEQQIAEVEQEAVSEPSAGTGAVTGERVEAAVEVPAGELAGFTDTVDVQVVNVDVVVTDKRGRPVTDLRRGDFEIYEDREPVEISHFVAPYPLPQGKVDRAVNPVNQETTDTPEEALGEALSLVLFIDNTRLDLRGRKVMARTVRSFLAEDLPPATRFMLLSYNGYLSVRQPFTEDSGALIARLEETTRGRTQAGEEVRKRREIADRLAQITRDLDVAQRTGDQNQLSRIESDRAALEAEMEAQEAESSQSIRKTLEDLALLVQSLGGIEGRKALIYIGDGLAFSGGRALSAGLEKAAHPSTFAAPHDGGQKNDLGIPYLFRDLTRGANANRVTFYTVTPPMYEQVNDVTSEGAGLDVRTAIQDRAISDVKEAVCMMSNTTGGRCQVGGTRPALLFDKTRADFDAAYSLGFTPSHPGDGDFHRIQVKVTRPGLRVRHREGYVDQSPEDRLRDRLSAALLFDAHANPLAMEIEFEKEEALDRGLHLVHLRVKVPVSRLALVPTSDPATRASRLKLLMTTMDERSRTTGVQEVPLSFQVAEERLEGGTELFYAHQVHLTLKEGPQRFALGLWDELGRSGSFIGRGIFVGQSASPPEGP